MTQENSSTPVFDPALFRDVIGHFATGVTIITTREGEIDFGVTVSAVTSLSLEPPMLLVCLNRTSRTGASVGRTRGYIDGHLYCSLLADLLRERGVTILAPAELIEASGAHVLVTTRGTVECDVVVNAAGAWAPRVGELLGVASLSARTS